MWLCRIDNLLLCTNLPLQAEQHNDTVEGLREKWHVANAESQTLSARVETLERWGEERTLKFMIQLSEA